MNINALLVDDEQKALDTLDSLIQNHCPNVRVIAKLTSPEDGLKKINELKPDLIFLDIDMPGMDGFEMLDHIHDRNFEVIFVTGSNYFAIKAFKVNAIDYILKPVIVDELISAVEKVSQLIETKNFNLSRYDKLIESLKSNKPKKITIHTGEGIVCLLPEDIIHVEADQAYSYIHMTNENKLVVSKNIKEIESILDKSVFFRVHKSHIINLEHVKKYNVHSGSFIEMTDGVKIIISRRNKKAFIERMESYINK